MLNSHLSGHRHPSAIAIGPGRRIQEKTRNHKKERTGLGFHQTWGVDRLPLLAPFLRDLYLEREQKDRERHRESV
ncbi:hypothetical protein Ao3042_00808 [Aspergillus oryzae 3.042]|uniref:Uncharacterized protein n=1 Tax=Aspergillus oryzae (strain 3.042) TaxID=1160506 RepID=I8AAN9_ASPO3|nr:hypothetical protein Ao3042_00808 [Aspergillus oryzae 3.042]|eukprot:EIT82069.1 hypothetical protein Ao3042_00808 [Aspergillus oryzae 3.042]